MDLTIDQLIEILKAQPNKDMPVFMKVYGTYERLNSDNIEVIPTIGDNGDEYDTFCFG